MKQLLFLLFCLELLHAQQLKIKADKFSADQKKGISEFSGHVFIKKGADELNASKVLIYTDAKNKPTKFIASGDVSFFIETKNKAKYTGKANKVVFKPKSKEYKFFQNVHLQQLNDKKEILGDEVVLKINSGKAYAKGMKAEPVIMIFDIPDEKEVQKKEEIK